jgi:hypothetical protein
MGLGLEMWDLSSWFAYVIAMILVEAWLIGRWLGEGWPKSLLISLGANFVTGVLCAGGGCLAPFLHTSFVGPANNPNPFLNSIVLLLIYAIPSALLEALFWVAIARPNRESAAVVGRSAFAHLVTVPVALVILLIPSRPYRGLEAMTAYQRRISLFDVHRALETFIQINGRLPSGRTPHEIAEQISNGGNDVERYEIALYRPEYGRFSMGDDWSHPLETNSALRGFKFPDKEGEEKWVWYVRDPDQISPASYGLAVDLGSGRTQLTRDPAKLGRK